MKIIEKENSDVVFVLDGTEENPVFELVDELVKYYIEESEVCFGELLHFLYVEGLSLDKVVRAFCLAMMRIEDDMCLISIEGDHMPLEHYLE